jgi:hypothetical protein
MGGTGTAYGLLFLKDMNNEENSDEALAELIICSPIFGLSKVCNIGNHFQLILIERGGA